MSPKGSNFTHFYIPSESIIEGQCRFSRDETDHILKSCRLYIGDTLHATDGKGNLYDIALTSFDDRLLRGRIVQQRRGVNELEIDLTIAFGLLPMAKTEQVIDQCTQLGAAHFIPLYTKHSRVSLKGEKLNAKITRWENVAISAMKQSLRTVLPAIDNPKDLSVFVDQVPHYDVCLLASLKGKEMPRLDSVVKGSQVLLLSGPEEGFSRIEEDNLIAAGVLPVSLGARRFRAELAPLILTSYFLAHYSL